MNESTKTGEDSTTSTHRSTVKARQVDPLGGRLRRRVVLRGGVLAPVGAGVVLLAACGQGEGDEAAGEVEEESEAEEAGEVASESGAEGEASGFPASEVPVGEATYDEGSNTVYSQPVEGEFRAFDATCPHQGCSVSDFAEGRLVCPCHGSEFDPDSGEVLGGPATSGLTGKEVTMSGDDLVVS